MSSTKCFSNDHIAARSQARHSPLSRFTLRTPPFSSRIISRRMFSTIHDASVADESSLSSKEHGSATSWRKREKEPVPIVTCHIRGNHPAGATAGFLSNNLRMGRRAEVKFVNGRGILKALKVFAISHDFLSQHRSTISFCPSFFRHSSIQEIRERGNYPDNDQEHEEKEGEDSERILEFTCHAWMRTCSPSDIPNMNDESMLDFSLDCRREWKNKTQIALDMAYNIADMLYGRFVSKEFPHSMVISADMAQSTTIFFALAVLQKRLGSETEQEPSVVMVSVFRNTALPRIDGRNGFIFTVRIQGQHSPSEPEQISSRRRTRPLWISHQ